MRFKVKMSFSAKMFVFILAMVLFMTAGSVFLVYRGSMMALKEKEIMELNALADGAMEKVDRNMFERASDISVLATSAVFVSGKFSSDKITKRMFQFMEECGSFASISFFDTARVRVADTSGLCLGEPAPPHKFWDDLLEGRESPGSDISFSVSLNAMVVFFASPVRSDGGEVIGYVVGRMPVSVLYEPLITLTKRHGEMGGHLEVDLIDKTGLLIYSNHNKEGIFKDNLSGLKAAMMSKVKQLLGGGIFSGDISVLEQEKGFLDFTGNDWTLILRVPEKLVYLPAFGLSWRLIAYMIMISGLALTAAFLFGRSVTKPLRDLRRGVLLFGRGHFDHRVDISSSDEIGEVAESFNIMAERIEKDREDLEREVSIREKAEEEIRKYASRLQVANQELEAFSYSVSHDLRAPLRSMDGFSEVLLADYADKLDDKGRDYLCRVRRASQRMAQLIEDLLQLSRVARREMKKEAVNLSEMTRTILADVIKEEPQREVQWDVKDGVRAEGDPHLLGVVMQNLLANAWKFTSKHPASRIEFGATEVDGEKTYFVRDDGAGFDMAYADKLFGSFQRLHSEAEFPGTGIGLATVKRIIIRHGGRVWAEGAVEKGATFYFTLPER